MKEKQMSDEQMSAKIKEMHASLDELENALIGREWDEERWTFPENKYTVLAVWLLYDPKAHRLFSVNKKKSWAELAERLTKYVGWIVDEHILRQNYTRKYLQNSKKEHNAL